MAKRLTLDELEKYLKDWKFYKDEKALEILVTCNEGLVRHFINRYLRKGPTYEDLFSAGKEGLMKAINNFDCEKYGPGVFSTYASLYIEGYMKKEVKRYEKHSHVLSFEQPIGHNKDGDEMTIEDIVGTDAEQIIEDVINEMKIEVVKEALKSLTTREKQIILLRYGLDDNHKKSQEELAQMFDCAQPTIQRQEQKALMKMRHPRNTKKLKDFMED